MPAKQKPLPSVEESLRKIAASQAETRAHLNEMARNQKEWQAKHEAEREADREGLAELKAILARIERDREAEREADRKALAAWKAAHDKAMADHDKAMDDHDKAMDDHEKTLASFRKEMNRWEKQAKRLRSDWGSFSGSEGEILEDNVVHAVSEAKEICGIALDDVIPDLRKRATGLQYDALGVNGKTAVVMEVKRTLGVDDVRNFLDKQMATVTRDYPQHTKGKKLIGAMICQNFHDDAVREALKSGLLLLRAESDKRLRQIKSVRSARRKT